MCDTYKDQQREVALTGHRLKTRRFLDLQLSPELHLDRAQPFSFYYPTQKSFIDIAHRSLPNAGFEASPPSIYNSHLLKIRPRPLTYLYLNFSKHNVRAETVWEDFTLCSGII